MAAKLVIADMNIYGVVSSLAIVALGVLTASRCAEEYREQSVREK